mgnify:CR=1 FL=1
MDGLLGLFTNYAGKILSIIDHFTHPLLLQGKICTPLTFGAVHKRGRQLGGRRGQKLVKKGPSINDVGHWEERNQKLVKIADGYSIRKIANMGEGGVKYPG